MVTKLRKVRCNEKNFCFGSGCGIGNCLASIRLQGCDDCAGNQPAQVAASHADAFSQPGRIAIAARKPDGYRHGYRNSNGDGDCCCHVTG